MTSAFLLLALAAWCRCTFCAAEAPAQPQFDQQRQRRDVAGSVCVDNGDQGRGLRPPENQVRHAGQALATSTLCQSRSESSPTLICPDLQECRPSSQIGYCHNSALRCRRPAPPMLGTRSPDGLRRKQCSICCSCAARNSDGIDNLAAPSPSASVNLVNTRAPVAQSDGATTF